MFNIRDSLVMDARALTQIAGGIWRNKCGQAPCPICQFERRRDQVALSISESDGKILLHCFKSGCDFFEIATALNMPACKVGAESIARRRSNQNQVNKTAVKLDKARSLWRAAMPISGSKAESYLRGRGINAPLPKSLRFLPNIYHNPSASWGCAMVADVRPTDGVHRTFLDKHGDKFTRSAKLMLGPCAGGAVHLFGGPGPLVVCEGIETGLSLFSGFLKGPSRVWASLSTSGMKALRLPMKTGELVVATDGDDPGRDAGNALAARATALGWTVSLMPAPDGMDWNDVLRARAVVA